MNFDPSWPSGHPAGERRAEGLRLHPGQLIPGSTSAVAPFSNKLAVSGAACFFASQVDCPGSAERRETVRAAVSNSAG
jgi:hypothetical protein